MISGILFFCEFHVRLGQRVAVGLEVSLSGTSGTGTPLSRQLPIHQDSSVSTETYCSGLVGICDNLLPDFL